MTWSNKAVGWGNMVSGIIKRAHCGMGGGGERGRRQVKVSLIAFIFFNCNLLLRSYAVKWFWFVKFVLCLSTGQHWSDYKHKRNVSYYVCTLLVWGIKIVICLLLKLYRSLQIYLTDEQYGDILFCCQWKEMAILFSQNNYCNDNQ